MTSVDLPIRVVPGSLGRTFFGNSTAVVLMLFSGAASSSRTVSTIKRVEGLTGSRYFVDNVAKIIASVGGLTLGRLPICIIVTTLLDLIMLRLADKSFMMPVLFLVDVKLTVLCGLKDGVFLKRASCVAGTLATMLRLNIAVSCSVFLLGDCRRGGGHFPKRGRHTVKRTVSGAFGSITKDSIAAMTKFMTLYIVAFTLNQSLNVIVTGNMLVNMVYYMAILPSLILMFSGLVRGAGRGLLLDGVSGPSTFVAGRCGM